MKKLMSLALLVALVFGGCTVDFRKNKPITGQIPSTDKLVLNGTKVSRAAGNEKKEWNVIDRLYDTIWFQTEQEYDDGQIETETEFVFFNPNSSVFELEVENGRAELPEADDYADLELVSVIDYTSELRPDGTDMNAWIVRKTERGNEREVEYEAYWLYSENVLYITEGDSEASVREKMIRIMDSLENGHDEKFLLSLEKPKY